jgi:hypothetical protein
MSRRHHGHREYGNGLVEFYRADNYANHGKHIDRARNDVLSTKYKLNRSELNTMRHLTVTGDKISYSNPHRNYIYHRQAFDWYNSKRALILDDMEEILPIAGSLSRPHVRSIYDSSQYFKAFSRYAPAENCEEEEDDELDVPEPPKPKPEPCVRFENIKNDCCLDKLIVNDIEKSVHDPMPFKGPAVIYHGNVRADGSINDHVASSFKKVNLNGHVHAKSSCTCNCNCPKCS